MPSDLDQFFRLVRDASAKIYTDSVCQRSTTGGYNLVRAQIQVEKDVVLSKFIITDDNQVSRCWWCGSDPLYVKYHDKEWGVPQRNDRKLFEKICLEGFQSGLSWITILRKRENFRLAFAKFEIQKVSQFGDKDVNRLLQDAGIIRHRGKIEATINNAQRALEMKKEHKTLANFFWQYQPSSNPKFDAKRAISKESTAMSKELKRLGWKFVGPTTCYSFMQAMGLVNDHHPKCHRHQQV